MGKIFYVCGKSASGKDSIYNRLKNSDLGLRTVIPYTTRPIREGEVDGTSYFFVNEAQVQELREDGKIVELRDYATVHGSWKYFTADDGQIQLEKQDYLMIGTLEGFDKIAQYFGRDKVIPFYIEVETGLRLQRALDRERQQKEPKYAEMCRRFLADEGDFSEERIQELQIEKRYQNVELEDCVTEIVQDIMAAKEK